jgi:hypothetical protein
VTLDSMGKAFGELAGDGEARQRISARARALMGRNEASVAEILREMLP